MMIAHSPTAKATRATKALTLKLEVYHEIVDDPYTRRGCGHGAAGPRESGLRFTSAFLLQMAWKSVAAREWLI